MARGTQSRAMHTTPGVPLLVEVNVKSLGLDHSNKTPLVLLQEIDGERVLPIWIGPSEARAIAFQLAEWEFERPLTHDLFCSVLKGLGASLSKVVVTRVEKGTYYAELLLERNGEVISVDARPSDSIAVALRVGAKVFVEEDLLDFASIEIADEDGTVDLEIESTDPESVAGIMGPDELKEHLKKLNPEDFGRFTP